MIVLLAAFFVGLRGDVGVDDLGYLKYFRETGSIDQVLFGSEGYWNIPRAYEPGFYYLMSVFKLFSEDFLVFKLFLAISTLGLVAYSYTRMTELYLIAFAMFLSLLLLAIAMHQIRNGLAMSLGLLAISFLIERRWVVFYCLVIFAFSIHFSALILLVCPIVLSNRFNNLGVFICIFGALVFKFLGGFTALLELVLGNGINNILLAKISGKFNDPDYYGSSIVFGLGFVKAFLIVSLCMYLRWKRVLTDKMQLLFKCYALGFCCFIALSDIGIFAVRAFRYFLIFEPVLIAYILSKFKPTLFVYIVTALYFLLYVYKDRHLLSDHPYSFGLL
ncbi:MAG: EpsG family protein [Oleiphilaceae bacterium]|nr:EpsG family protein [Oleiphilaceae bacterium]